MLGEIYQTLKQHQGEPLPDKVTNEVPNKVPNKLIRQHPDISDSAWEIYLEIKADAYASAEVIGAKLGLSSRMVRKHVSSLRTAGLIRRVGPNKGGHWEIIE